MSYSKKDKLKELIWFICKNYNYDLYITKLWKLVFFVDADFYEKYNSTISDVKYIKNNYGPTPSYSTAEKALNELIKEGFISKSKNDSYIAINDLGLKYLDSQKVDAIRSTCEKYYKLSTRDICLLAHKDPIYLSAEKKNDLLDFDFVIYRDDYLEEETEFEKVTFSKKAQEGLLKSCAM